MIGTSYYVGYFFERKKVLVRYVEVLGTQVLPYWYRTVPRDYEYLPLPYVRTTYVLLTRSMRTGTILEGEYVFNHSVLILVRTYYFVFRFANAKVHSYSQFGIFQFCDLIDKMWYLG